MVRVRQVSLAWLLATVIAPGALVFAADEKQPFRIRQTTDPIYPPTQIQLGIFEGHARIAINVDAAGRLQDFLAVAYSHRDFADAAITALRKWAFEPLRVGGEPVPVQVDLTFDFRTSGSVISIDASSGLNALLGGKSRFGGYAPCPLNELDRLPRPVNRIAPRYPPELADRGVSGLAVVEFYVDESGAVRLPAVTRADFVELGNLAVEAVRQWTFEPPKRNGKPVLIQARQTLRFGEQET